MDMHQELMPGATVYGADGDKVGTIAGVGGSYIVVEKGFFFPKDYYIPVSAVTDSNENAVYLSVTKDVALEQGWDQMPAEHGLNGLQDDPRWRDGEADTQASTAHYDDMSTADSTSLEQDMLRVPIHEEHLEATKRMDDAGDVTITKQVVQEQEVIEVPVTEERVRVQWRAPSGDIVDDGEAFEEGVIEVPVSREVVDVSKRTVRTGELEVTKERQQRTQRVADSVRREVVDVRDASGDTLMADQ
jgi:uncharacterized protein (TIGR02271 family)